MDQEPLESRQKMNSEMLHKSNRFANVGAPIKKGLPEDPVEKKAAIAQHRADLKKAQKSKEEWMFDNMLVQTGSHFGERLQEAKRMVIEERVADWELEFSPYWLRYMLMSKWRCRKLAILRRKPGTECQKQGGDVARYKLLYNQWKELMASTPDYGDIDDERERLQAQASWRRKQVKEMRDSNQYAYWSQVRNSKDPWWEGF
jgi:hypothetical protein